MKEAELHQHSRCFIWVTVRTVQMDALPADAVPWWVSELKPRLLAPEFVEKHISTL